jgi:hypothetical protein
MSPIKKPYNEFQSMAYQVNHGKPKVRQKVLFWVVEYNGRALTKPMSYSACQVEIKTYRMMGRDYPSKQLLKIMPSKL